MHADDLEARLERGMARGCATLPNEHNLLHFVRGEDAASDDGILARRSPARKKASSSFYNAIVTMVQGQANRRERERERESPTSLL